MDDGRLISGRTVKGPTSLAFIRLVPSDDRVFGHICWVYTVCRNLGSISSRFVSLRSLPHTNGLTKRLSEIKPSLFSIRSGSLGSIRFAVPKIAFSLEVTGKNLCKEQPFNFQKMIKLKPSLMDFK